MSVSTFAQGSLGVTEVPTSGNAIINGAFDIWQRGTSFTNPSANTYTADRFNVEANGTGATRTISRLSLSPAEIIANNFGDASFALRFNQSVAGSGGTINFFRQRIEDVRTLSGQVVTLSFWAKANAEVTLETPVFSQNFGSGGSSSTFTGSRSYSLTTSWQRFTFTVTMPSVSGATIGTNSFVDLYLRLPLNSTFTFDIWGVQLEAGAVATPFKRNAPSIAAELAACQRYYQRFRGGVGCGLTGMGANSIQMLLNYSLPVTMRANATPGVSGQIGFSDQFSTDPTATNATLDNVQGNTQNGGRIVMGGFTGLTLGRYYSTPGSFAGSGFVDFSAEM
jgi:hypothetical protein